MAKVNVGWWANPDPLYLGEGFLVGDRRRRSRRLTLNMDARTRHKVVVGGSGSGKSQEARHELEQDIRHNRSFSLLDAQDLVRETLAVLADVALPGPLTNDAIEQLGDKVILIEPALVEQYGSVGYNFLAPRPGVPLFDVVDALIQLLTELWPDAMGARLIDISRNSLLCLGELGYTLAEMVLFLSDASVRNLLVRRCQNDDVKTFFGQHLGGLRASEQRIWFESSRNKWSSFTASPYIRPLVGQAQSTFSFEDVLANGKIVLINLSRHHMKLESRSVAGGMFINSLHQAAIGREDTPVEERYLHSVYVDEAQSYWTETMAEILEAGRKYGLSLNLYFQSTRQRPWDTNQGAIDTILANSHTRVCFGVARQDAERMAREFLNTLGTRVKYQRSILGLPTERATFWSLGEEHENFVAELMHQQPREAHVSFKGLTDNSLPYQLLVPLMAEVERHTEKVAALREHVARRYARPVHEINAEIEERWRRLRAEARVRDDG